MVSSRSQVFLGQSEFGGEVQATVSRAPFCLAYKFQDESGQFHNLGLVKALISSKVEKKSQHIPEF